MTTENISLTERMDNSNFKRPDKAVISEEQYNNIEQFVRLNHRNILETPIISYELETNTSKQLTIVGVAHLAEKEYFQKLYSILEQHEQVFYEKLQTDPSDKSNNSAGAVLLKSTASLAKIVKKKHGLEYQLTAIDYNSLDKKKWENVDITFKECVDKLNHAETKPKYIQKQIMLYTGAAISKIASNILFRTASKQTLANKISSPIELNQPLQEALMTARNKVVLDRIKEYSEDEKYNSAAVFYGAKHLEEFHPEVIKMGYKPMRVWWIEAW